MTMGVKQKDEADKGERKQAGQLLSILSRMRDCHCMAEGKLVGRSQHSACLHAGGSDGHTCSLTPVFSHCVHGSVKTHLTADTAYLEGHSYCRGYEQLKPARYPHWRQRWVREKSRKLDGRCMWSKRYAPRLMD